MVSMQKKVKEGNFSQESNSLRNENNKEKGDQEKLAS